MILLLIQSVSRLLPSALYQHCFYMPFIPCVIQALQAQKHIHSTPDYRKSLPAFDTMPIFCELPPFYWKIKTSCGSPCIYKILIQSISCMVFSGICHPGCSIFTGNLRHINISSAILSLSIMTVDVNIVVFFSACSYFYSCRNMHDLTKPLHLFILQIHTR